MSVSLFDTHKILFKNLKKNNFTLGNFLVRTPQYLKKKSFLLTKNWKPSSKVAQKNIKSAFFFLTAKTEELMFQNQAHRPGLCTLISCPPDQTTDFKTTNPICIRNKSFWLLCYCFFDKNNIIWVKKIVVSELVNESGEQDIDGW